MTKYTFKDIDATIAVMREYLQRKERIPGTLVFTLGQMCSTDLKLGVYFHWRLLSYPTLRRACCADDTPLKQVIPEGIQTVPQWMLLPPPETVGTEFQ